VRTRGERPVLILLPVLLVSSNLIQSRSLASVVDHRSFRPRGQFEGANAGDLLSLSAGGTRLSTPGRSGLVLTGVGLSTTSWVFASILNLIPVANVKGKSVLFHHDQDGVHLRLPHNVIARLFRWEFRPVSLSLQ